MARPRSPSPGRWSGAQDLEATADRTTAQLLTAELVANALKHTHDPDPIELVVDLGPAGCRVAVHDGDRVLVEGVGEPPADPTGDETAPDGAHGRGLLLIRSLSSASGCHPTSRGKAVWFTLPESRRRRGRR